jgi:molybdopterin adenylyltransferase
VRAGVLTISDRASAGEYEDKAGPLLKDMIIGRLRWEVAAAEAVPDEVEAIQHILMRWVDDEQLDLIVTTGGTGFAPRDVTPEATRAVIEREAPGLAEAMRAASLPLTPHAMLSRAVCGIRKRTLIVNLPGSPRAAREQFEVILPVLPHALSLLTESPDAESGHQSLRQA